LVKSIDNHPWKGFEMLEVKENYNTNQNQKSAGVGAQMLALPENWGWTQSESKSPQRNQLKDLFTLLIRCWHNKLNRNWQLINYSIQIDFKNFIQLSSSGCTGVDVTAGVGIITDVGITTGVGVLDGIGIDNSFSGCTVVDITAGIGVTTDVNVTADVGAFNGFCLWKFPLLPRSRRFC
jgi:hypothetical protein